MVLPAPAAHAESPASAWLERLSRILRLAGRSVLVLVDRARPEKLGELARPLLREYPDAEVLTEAPLLSTLPEGSTVILCVRAEDADWLNQERPVIQERSLRVVLFSDEATTLHLARRAVDFYDWISHRIDCPEGPPAFAVRALRRAACARAPALVWTGGDLELTFAKAFPGRTLERVSASQPYVGLVDALRSRPRTWIAVTQIDGVLRERRTLWAVAEARRRGRLLLVEPSVLTDNIPRAGARALSIDQAARHLSEGGVRKPARLAAILELDPQMINIAAALDRSGIGEATLARTALDADDPGAALARLAAPQPRETAPTTEAHASPPIVPAQGPLELPDWPERIDMAIHAGDLDAAEHWSAGWRAATNDSARSLASLAYLRTLESRHDDARALLDEAQRRAAPPIDDETRLELLRAEGAVLLHHGHHRQAIRPLTDGLALARRSGRTIDRQAHFYRQLIEALLGQGRHKDAERLLGEWTMQTREIDSASLARAVAIMQRMQGRADEAAALVESVLKKLPDPDHPTWEALALELAVSWLILGRYGESERLLRETIARAERLDRNTTLLRLMHANAFMGLGRLAEAELELRAVLNAEPDPDNEAEARHDLAKCLLSQGRSDEAEAMVDEALQALRANGNEEKPRYAVYLQSKAAMRAFRGDLEGAAVLYREALARNERLFGRSDSSLLKTLEALGTILIALKKAHDAEPLLRRAVQLAEQGADPPALASTLRVLAIAQAEQGFSHAGDTARRALKAWHDMGEEPPPAVLQELEPIVARGEVRSSTPARKKR